GSQIRLNPKMQKARMAQAKTLRRTTRKERADLKRGGLRRHETQTSSSHAPSKTAIRQIDKIVWKLHDEQLTAYVAYVLVVSKGEKREIRRLFGAKFAAFGDLAAELECKLTLKERRRAVRLTAYEAEMAALHDAAKRLQSHMEASYMQQRRFKNDSLDEFEEKHPKAANARQRSAAA